ncbi:MAG: universal stress protein [Pseudomonadota bacterium]
MHQHILLATDGSTHALVAAKYAGNLARAFSSHLSILTVLDPSAIVETVWGSVLPPVSKPEQELSSGVYESRLLDSVIPPTISALGDVDGEPVVAHTWGHPARDICHYAKQHNADHIIMGSHGRGPISAALLGSVSHGVVNRAECSVTIVR